MSRLVPDGRNESRLDRPGRAHPVGDSVELRHDVATRRGLEQRVTTRLWVLELLTGARGGRVRPGEGPADPRHRLVAPRLVVRDGPR